MLVFCRIVQGFGGAMMVPVGRLTIVRAFPKFELVRAMSFVAIPALIGPMIGPLAGGLIVGFFHWRVIFFLNIPIGLLGFYFVLKSLPDYRERAVHALDIIGLILFGSGVALLSYVLEVFGEHSLSKGEILGLFGLSMALLLGYGIHARTILHPLLRLSLLKIRTFKASVQGNFITRLGAGGMPFLLPLLYQVGLGYTPLQSGLLIMPQPLAAICFRFYLPQILVRFGYRNVLVFNTVAIGLAICLFSFINVETPVWVIVLEACCFGFTSSLQYTSMNTLGFADVDSKNTSMASMILSTTQQMSLSFGVAVASLVTAIFIPDRFHSTPTELVSGLHRAFITMGIVTITSSLVFSRLKSDDGDNVSRHGPATPHA
jgi:MFS family permease